MSHPILNVAVQAIRKAGNFIIKQYELLSRNTPHLSSSCITTLVSKIKIESKHIIITMINKFYPSHKINMYKNNTNDVCWIIEALDNNINFIKQFPFFSLSIAVQYKGHIEVGVIYDPVHNELFSACRGKGAQYNGYRIRLNNNYINKYFNTVILAISVIHLKQYITAIDILHTLNKEYITVEFRQTGSIILDLVYVAVGRIDGCLLITSLEKMYKLAGAILIIKESGGFIATFNDNKFNHSEPSNNIVAGHPKIVKLILTLIKQHV